MQANIYNDLHCIIIISLLQATGFTPTDKAAPTNQQYFWDSKATDLSPDNVTQSLSHLLL